MPLPSIQDRAAAFGGGGSSNPRRPPPRAPRRPPPKPVKNTKSAPAVSKTNAPPPWVKSTSSDPTPPRVIHKPAVVAPRLPPAPQSKTTNSWATKSPPPAPSNQVNNTTSWMSRGWSRRGSSDRLPTVRDGEFGVSKGGKEILLETSLLSMPTDPVFFILWFAMIGVLLWAAFTQTVFESEDSAEDTKKTPFIHGMTTCTGISFLSFAYGLLQFAIVKFTNLKIDLVLSHLCIVIFSACLFLVDQMEMAIFGIVFEVVLLAYGCLRYSDIDFVDSMLTVAIQISRENPWFFFGSLLSVSLFGLLHLMLFATVLDAYTINSTAEDDFSAGIMFLLMIAGFWIVSTFSNLIFMINTATAAVWVRSAHTFSLFSSILPQVLFTNLGSAVYAAAIVPVVEMMQSFSSALGGLCGDCIGELVAFYNQYGLVEVTLVGGDFVSGSKGAFELYRNNNAAFRGDMASYLVAVHGVAGGLFGALVGCALADLDTDLENVIQIFVVFGFIAGYLLASLPMAALRGLSSGFLYLWLDNAEACKRDVGSFKTPV